MDDLLEPGPLLLESLWSWVSNDGAPGIPRDPTGLTRARLVFLAAEFHAALFLTLCKELRTIKPETSWKSMHKRLMNERTYILPPVKGKDTKAATISPTASTATLFVPSTTPMQLTHLRATAGFLLKQMNLSGTGRVSKNEFQTMFGAVATKLLGPAANAAAREQKEDGVLACSVM